MEKLNKIFKASEISSIDKYTIEHEPIRSLDLMERASQEWVKKFFEKFSREVKIIVVAGCGNNGGDGFAIARLLMEKGMNVKIFHILPANGMSPDCEANRRRYIAIGGAIVEVSRAEDFAPEGNFVLVDALFGTGLNRPLSGLYAEVIRKINALSRCVVAVDIPSGLMGEDNSGNNCSAIVQARYTFTFQFPKLAFMLAENEPYVGEWEVLDIGLHPAAIAEKQTNWYYVTAEAAASCLPRLSKFVHKGTNGRGLLIAGTHTMMGAAVLSAKAAVHSGVGLLHCHIPASRQEVMYIAVPEALVDADASACCFSGVNDMACYNAVAVGPAIGKAPETVEALKRLLQEWRGTTIIDADALNILSVHSELLPLLHEGCILTPHVGEFERLAGKSENDFERLNKLSIFANYYKVYVILKGAYSVIATPGGELYFNMSGNPGMAKGGSGDVLTGVLLALAANGIPPLEVAVAGVYAHGLAGDMAAGAYGQRGVSSGLIAESLGLAWLQLERLGDEARRNVNIG